MFFNVKKNMSNCHSLTQKREQQLQCQQIQNNSHKLFNLPLVKLEVHHVVTDVATNNSTQRNQSKQYPVEFDVTCVGEE